MRKLILGLLRLLVTAGLLLSGCGLRPCLHTTTGCQTDNSETDKPCREFGGPTTGCQQSLGADHWTVTARIASTAPAMRDRCSMLAGDGRE
jgi:hypothetical protein